MAVVANEVTGGNRPVSLPSRCTRRDGGYAPCALVDRSYWNRVFTPLQLISSAATGMVR